MNSSRSNICEAQDQGWREFRPTGGALPAIPLARELSRMGRNAYEPLLHIASGEKTDNLRFRNALFCLSFETTSTTLNSTGRSPSPPHIPLVQSAALQQYSVKALRKKKDFQNPNVYTV